MIHNNKFIICSILFFFLSFILVSQPYCEGDSITLKGLNYVSGDVQWQYSYDNVDWHDIYDATGLNYVFYPVSDLYYLRLKITDPECLPAYYTEMQIVELIPQPTQANAGEDQKNIEGFQTNLNANNYNSDYENGIWEIISGSGGNIQNPNNPNTVFTGNKGSEYNLSWKIFNQCGQTQDNVIISFQPEQEFVCGSSFIDSRDGQEYPTVEIGNQCWMAKNLAFLPSVDRPSTTSNTTAYYYVYGYDGTNVADAKNHEIEGINIFETYGVLYNWAAVMQGETSSYSNPSGVQGICPSGWHVPSDNEWKELEIALGMTQQEADSYNTWRGAGIGTALNIGGSTGFDAIFGGRAQGHFALLNTAGYYYTSTQFGETHAWRRCFQPNLNTVGRWNSFQKLHGYSLRCVKTDQ